MGCLELKGNYVSCLPNSSGICEVYPAHRNFASLCFIRLRYMAWSLVDFVYTWGWEGGGVESVSSVS